MAGFSQMDMSSAVDGLIASAAQGAASPGQMMGKEMLVQRVKDWQRKGPDQKEQWWTYCKASGNTNFDPGRHEAPFLQGFFDFVEGRAPLPTKGCSKGGGGGAKMFIGGLPKSTTEEKVWELFGYYGTVKEVVLKWSDEGVFRGFGFVLFEDPASVQAAIAGTKDNTIDGKWIDCKNSDEISGKGGKGKDGKGGKGGKGKDGKGGKGGGKGKDWGNMDPWTMMTMMMTMMKGKKGKKGDMGGKSGGGKGDGPKPGDWTCPNCGDSVFARNKECRMCGTAKPADAGGGAGASWGGGGGGASWGGGGGAAASTAEFKPGDWECPQCGNHCFSSKSSCKKCGYQRDASAAAEANKAKMRPGDWTCSICGDLVFASKSACSMCGMGKPIDEQAAAALPGFGAMPAAMGNAYPAAAMMAAMGHPGPY